MTRLRKRVWVSSACILGVLSLVVLARWLPGPIEGAYKFPYDLCCGDGYDFYYFETNTAILVYEEAPPAFKFGTYFKSNGTWYLRVPGKTNSTVSRLEPHLFFLRIDDDRLGELTATRSFRFWKVEKILRDPQQWKPAASKKKQ